MIFPSELRRTNNEEMRGVLAHSANVNCLNIGKKTLRVLITGGDDYKVNLWAIGKPTSLMWFELLLDIDPTVLLLNVIRLVNFWHHRSSDTNLKIWDIRKKGCIQTYKGHTRGINTIKFTPDGRWVVTGGLDNVVK
ncbi:hypothetical protein EUTSA_v10024116mg, partial [Eutrema salsugineum]